MDVPAEFPRLQPHPSPGFLDHRPHHLDQGRILGGDEGIEQLEILRGRDYASALHQRKRCFGKSLFAVVLEHPSARLKGSWREYAAYTRKKR